MKLDLSDEGLAELTGEPVETVRAARRRLEFAKRIGTRIRQARLAKGFTQTQLGEKLGVSKGRISQYESGDMRHSPNIATIIEISEWLDCEPESFFVDVPDSGQRKWTKIPGHELAEEVEIAASPDLRVTGVHFPLLLGTKAERVVTVSKRARAGRSLLLGDIAELPLKQLTIRLSDGLLAATRNDPTLASKPVFSDVITSMVSTRKRRV